MSVVRVVVLVVVLRFRRLFLVAEDRRKIKTGMIPLGDVHGPHSDMPRRDKTMGPSLFDPTNLLDTALRYARRR